MYSYSIECKTSYNYLLDIIITNIPIEHNPDASKNKINAPHYDNNPAGHLLDNKGLVNSIKTINYKLRNKISLAKKDIDKNYKNGDWDYIKTLTNPYELIFSGSKKFVGKNIKYVRNNICDINPLSRSFFKMVEISNQFLLSRLLKQNIPCGIRTLHLAEGPGGFIEGIIHQRQKYVPAYIQAQDIYYGMTLIDKSNHIEIPSWKKSTTFLRQNPNVIITSGYDGTGNLYNKCNIDYIRARFANKMDLVTADGGFDFSVDYNSQEYLACRLIYSEILGALISLKPGGTFICKFFDIINKLTVDFLYILQCKFKYIFIYKPKTSRMANSEKYIICLNYVAGLSDAEYLQLIKVIDTFELLDGYNNKPASEYKILDSIIKDVPAGFIKYINNISNEIIDKQTENIKLTISLINKYAKGLLPPNTIDEILIRQKNNAYAWCAENNMRCRMPLVPG